MPIDYAKAIDKSRSDLSIQQVAQKVFLSYPTFCFDGNEDDAYLLTAEAAAFFSVPISAVAVAGSGKTGFSFHKDSKFSVKDSDIDLAIIDSNCFLRYMENVLLESDGYQPVKFPRRNGTSTRNDFVNYIAKGMFRPDLMPTGAHKQEIINFGRKLSRKFKNLASDVSIAIYASENAFLYKQKRAIELVRDLKSPK